MAEVSTDNPLPKSELLGKFRSLTVWFAIQEKAKSLAEQVWRLVWIEDTRNLVALAFQWVQG